MKSFERKESKYSSFKNKGLVNIYGSTDRFKRTVWERERIREEKNKFNLCYISLMCKYNIYGKAQARRQDLCESEHEVNIKLKKPGNAG